MLILVNNIPSDIFEEICAKHIKYGSDEYANYIDLTEVLDILEREGGSLILQNWKIEGIKQWKYIPWDRKAWWVRLKEWWRNDRWGSKENE
jgi:hypothetical protein